jgi:hypothetical protein
VEILKHAFGGVKTLFGNVLPNVLKIAESTACEFESTHARAGFLWWATSADVRLIGGPFRGIRRSDTSKWG